MGKRSGFKLLAHPFFEKENSTNYLPKRERGGGFRLQPDRSRSKGGRGKGGKHKACPLSRRFRAWEGKDEAARALIEGRRTLAPLLSSRAGGEKGGGSVKERIFTLPSRKGDRAVRKQLLPRGGRRGIGSFCRREKRKKEGRGNPYFSLSRGGTTSERGRGVVVPPPPPLKKKKKKRGSDCATRQKGKRKRKRTVLPRRVGTGRRKGKGTAYPLAHGGKVADPVKRQGGNGK